MLKEIGLGMILNTKLLSALLQFSIKTKQVSNQFAPSKYFDEKTNVVAHLQFRYGV